MVHRDLLTARSKVAFAALLLAQAAHSVEEYIGRLWESFPPARFLTGLVSQDRDEAINGIVHPIWTLREGGYTPGVATSPVLLALAVCLGYQLRKHV